jgi:hypothetical protein
MRPLIEALRAADVGRLRGHCGSPPVDYVEQVLLIVYDPSRGRLQANSFSFSGNTQGCDPAIRALQSAIDAVQAKISPAPLTSPTISPTPSAGGVEPLPTVTPPGTGPAAPASERDAAPPPVLTAPAIPSPSTPPLRLTPVDE